MGMLLITHDLGVVARTAHRVGVMYAAELIETAPRDDFFRAPLHPYSRALFGALPRRRHSRRGLVGGSTFRRTPISRAPLDKNPMPGHLSELPPVNAVNTKG